MTGETSVRYSIQVYVLTEAAKITSDSNTLLAATPCRSFSNVWYSFVFTKQLNSQSGFKRTVFSKVFTTVHASVFILIFYVKFQTRNAFPLMYFSVELTELVEHYFSRPLCLLKYLNCF